MPFDLTRGAPKRIAIVGGGISGLASAWLLSGSHQVTLFEAEKRIGGHARTVMAGRNGDLAVDTGFIVFNHVNYPHLTSLFRDLEVPIAKSDMGFGVSLDGGRVEYGLRTLNTIYAQRRNLLSPRFHGMIRDILKFHAEAEACVENAPDMTISGMVEALGLGAAFRDDYLYPFCCAIWSTPMEDIDRFPAQALVRFMGNHALLSSRDQHQWWTVDGGSVAYVERLVAALRQRGVTLRAGSPVQAVTRDEAGVTVRSLGGEAEDFDHVIMATHSDQTIGMLADADEAERSALSAIRFQPNRIVLHRDPTVMPKRQSCWSSWICQSDAGSGRKGMKISYWMNQLQNLPKDDPLFVTLNPDREFDERMVYDENWFDHPLFDHAALAAQKKIQEIQGNRNTWFAGAWLRNGFHEDGFASAVRIARRLLPAEVAI